jgi:hypothetical protein
VKPIHKFYIFDSLVLLNLTSWASNNSTNIIQDVSVADFKVVDEDIALPLTVDVLNKHGMIVSGQFDPARDGRN